MGESVSGPRGSNRDIYPGRIHWISDRNFCRALTRDRWQFAENLSYPSLPCLPSSPNYSPRDYPSEIVNGRKNAKEIRSFPMKIRQGRSEAVRPSLLFPSLQKSNFCFTSVCTGRGRENISLLPEETEVAKFKLPQTLERTSRGNGEHAWNYVNFASCQAQRGAWWGSGNLPVAWHCFLANASILSRRIRRKFHP